MSIVENIRNPQEPSRKSSSVDEYDIIRWIGTVLVVMGHSAYTTMLTETGGIQIDATYGKVYKVILLLVRLIYSFHMPMFVALSGALFYHTKAYMIGFKIFITKKIQRLILPFIVVSFFWSIPLKALSGYWKESSNPIRNIIIGQFIRFDNNYLWYIISLFWIFCLFYVLYTIQKEKQRIVIIMIVCFSLFIIGQMITFNYIGIRNAMTHSVWFGAGIAYEKYREGINKVMAQKKYQIVFVLLSIGLYFAYLTLFKNNVYFYALIAIFGMGCVWIISFYLRRSCFLNTVCYKIILKYSFYIYLLSDPLNYCVISMVKRFELSYLYNSNLFCIMIFVARVLGTIFMSIFITCTISKIKQKVLSYAKKT